MVVDLQGGGESGKSSFKTWDELKASGVSILSLALASPEVRMAFSIFTKFNAGQITKEQRVKLEDLCRAGRMEDVLRILESDDVEGGLVALQDPDSDNLA